MCIGFYTTPLPQRRATENTFIGRSNTLCGKSKRLTDGILYHLVLKLKDHLCIWIRQGVIVFFFISQRVTESKPLQQYQALPAAQ